MKRLFAALMLCAVSVVAFVPLAAMAQPQQEPSRRALGGKDMGSDRAVSGRDASQSRPVEGDLFAAGRSVDVLSEVGGDAALAGGTVRVAAPVNQSVYAAGGRVSIDGPVKRNVRMAGGSLEVGPTGRVTGNVSAGGGEVRILGPITGYLHVGAGRVFINASVGGDVEVRARQIELGPKAVVSGRLRYASRSELVRDPAAQVSGEIEQVEAAPRAADMRAPRRAGRWIWTAGLMVLAAVLVAGLPAQSVRVRETMGRRPAASALTGFVALVCIPVAVIVLALTVVGAPIALLLLLSYPALLLVGYVAAGVAAGTGVLGAWKGEAMGTRGWQALAAALGVLAISLLARVPWLGALVALAALLLGLGALVLSVYDARSRGTPRTDAKLAT